MHSITLTGYLPAILPNSDELFALMGLRTSGRRSGCNER